MRSSIVEGRLSPDSRLDEVSLSQRMGVSRTPLREALIALQEEGLVKSLPNRGFVVVPADVALVREVYPILGALERLAIGLGATRLVEAVPDLEDLNDRLAEETETAAQYMLDMAFHDRLVRDCGNERLLRLIEVHRAQARRFDGAHRRGTADREGSCAEHRRMIEAITDRRFTDVQQLLEEHWRRGEDVVIGWLESRR